MTEPEADAEVRSRLLANDVGRATMDALKRLLADRANEIHALTGRPVGDSDLRNLLADCAMSGAQAAMSVFFRHGFVLIQRQGNVSIEANGLRIELNISPSENR